MPKISDNKIALLIDAENVSEKYIKYILDELSNYGIPTYKKIYGDWSSDAMKRWKNVIMTFSINPVQQYSYTTGKNSSDSALIIDAMDILYTGNVQGFCIVSSDSDFTRLATRLREAGKTVIGMGERKTPKALISACDKFIYLEVLVPKEEKFMRKRFEYKPDRKIKEKPVKDIAPEIKIEPAIEIPQIIETPVIDVPQPPAFIEEQDNHVGENIYEIVNAIKVIVNEISNDDGLASLADIGNALTRRFPEFDARNYGFTKFSQFMNSLNDFEVVKIKPEGHTTELMFVKLK